MGAHNCCCSDYTPSLLFDGHVRNECLPETPEDPSDFPDPMQIVADRERERAKLREADSSFVAREGPPTDEDSQSSVATEPVVPDAADEAFWASDFLFPGRRRT